MENELMIFNNEKFGEVRMVKINGKPYGVGKDIATVLGYKDPSSAVSKHCKNRLKTMIEAPCQNGNVVKTQTTLIPQGDILRLVASCKLDGAEEFESWIFDEVIPKVLETGKFDIVENKIEQIKDEKEKELTLGLYSLEQALKTNPNDISISILVNLKKGELNTYKQQKQLEEINNKVGDIGKRIENFITIGDRIQFVHEVNSVCRATGVKQSEIYNSTYIKLKELYGIDLKARSRNEKERIQNDRINEGKKPYSPNTLNNKAGCLVIADEKSIWNELGKSSVAVRDELLKEDK
mgnify:FL=1